MFFRDVIDLMGGVDITLEEDLVDPTYKTCDEAGCSTLYYAAGEHHLNGTEVAYCAVQAQHLGLFTRRKAAADFEGIKDKAMGLGIGDAETLFVTHFHRS